MNNPAAMDTAQGCITNDRPLAIVATGLVTGVGLDTASSCAAIRASIDNFQETRFMDDGGEWILGCEVSLEEPWRGTRKLAKMLARALAECAEEGGVSLADTPILICLAEKERPGRAENLGSRVFFEVQEELQLKFHMDSQIIEHGRVSAAVGLRNARKLLYETSGAAVIVAGVDSLLNAQTIKVYLEQDRVLCSTNSNGFIPGEGAAAIMLRKPARESADQLVCRGLGFARESATIDSDSPLRSDGLVSAVKASLAEASMRMEEMDFRIVDVTGEHYWFKESSLALLRTLHTPKKEFDIWNPVDCIGETGAALGLTLIVIARVATSKSYSMGNNILCHLSNIDDRRAAIVLRQL